MKRIICVSCCALSVALLAFQATAAKTLTKLKRPSTVYAAGGGTSVIPAGIRGFKVEIDETYVRGEADTAPRPAEISAAILKAVPAPICPEFYIPGASGKVLQVRDWVFRSNGAGDHPAADRVWAALEKRQLGRAAKEARKISDCEPAAALLAVLEKGSKRSSLAKAADQMAVAASGSDRLTDLLNRGALYEAAGRPLKAGRDFAEALKIKSAPRNLSYRLALLQLAQFDDDSARKTLTAAVLMEPPDPNESLLLGLIESRHENWHAAEKAVRRTLEIDPSDAYAHLVDAVIQHQLHRSDAAGAAAKKAIKLAQEQGASPAELKMYRRAQTEIGKEK